MKDRLEVQGSDGPQVTGPMTPEGAFYGEEPFQDRVVRLRFTWRVDDPVHARWEQAYAEAGSDAWETNWRMAFTRAHWSG